LISPTTRVLREPAAPDPTILTNSWPIVPRNPA
jgi:hypothetical protein